MARHHFLLQINVYIRFLKSRHVVSPIQGYLNGKKMFQFRCNYLRGDILNFSSLVSIFLSLQQRHSSQILLKVFITMWFIFVMYKLQRVSITQAPKLNYTSAFSFRSSGTLLSNVLIHIFDRRPFNSSQCSHNTIYMIGNTYPQCLHFLLEFSLNLFSTRKIVFSVIPL